MNDFAAEGIEIMLQNGAEKHQGILGGTPVDLYIASKLEPALAGKLRSQVHGFTFGKDGMVIEIPYSTGGIDLNEIGRLSADELKEQLESLRQYSDLFLVSKSDLPVQVSFLSKYGYTDGTKELNQRLRDCELLLSEIWSLARFKLDVVTAGHCGIFFEPKLKASQLAPIAELVDAFVEMHDIRDLSKKGLLTHMRASGSVIF